MVNSWEIVAAMVGICIVSILLRWRLDQLYLIPTIGPSFPLLSYIGAFRYYKDAPGVLAEGYTKYKTFKVAMFDKWVVIVSGADMNEELRKVPDFHADFLGAVDELFCLRYSFSETIADYPIHIPVVRGPLTKNLGVVSGDVLDEINKAFADTLDSELKGGDWLDVDVLSAMAVITSRASSRIFVGLPLCRNEEYLRIVRQFTFDVLRARYFLNWFPKPMKRIVGPFLPWARRARRQASVYLKPMIEDRQNELKEIEENLSDKPNDYLMWVMDEAARQGLPIKIIVDAILASNIAAIHTSSNSITHALYHLAGSPQYAMFLREEVEGVVRENGWNKIAVGKLWKLDSFMRESQRLNGITHIAVMRKAKQDFTLSDGTFIPAGTLVTGASTATHRDARNYENPEVFDPLRFADMRSEEGASIKHQFVSTSPAYVPFGHGKQACPGRFFAVNELKVMMAYILLHYDSIKFDGGKGNPDNWSRWHSVIPGNATVLFRRRQDE